MEMGLSGGESAFAGCCRVQWAWAGVRWGPTVAGGEGGPKPSPGQSLN